MNGEALVARLESGGEILRGIVSQVSESDSILRPAGGGWSIREVLGHLLCEETEDFRARVDFVLHRPDGDWPMLDPEARVREGGFQQREARELLAAFLAERRRSVEWLRGLPSPDWSLARMHPRLGPMRTGDFLAAWAAHDLLHARQIARILHGIVVAEGVPFRTDYAGNW